MIRTRYETLEIQLTDEEKTILRFLLERRLGIVDIKLVVNDEKDASVLKVGMEIGIDDNNKLETLNCAVSNEDELMLRELLEKLKISHVEEEWDEVNRRINLLYDATFASIKI